ncbi:hypothetical protein F3Y22_tig00007895pilonHSYRG00063 [Hibiscus syriacus]|uniref:Uncharacterized protein n=1 Tax=Hibiscus syriacus TaxID=106335 RepID=A0A6A3CF46_HIBSY|nr:hypothetical protein F3Y22_tig00007895pilonHSYRG00063 [Hibiscus syriacus]
MFSVSGDGQGFLDRSEEGASVSHRTTSGDSPRSLAWTAGVDLLESSFGTWQRRRRLEARRLQQLPPMPTTGLPQPTIPTLPTLPKPGTLPPLPSIPNLPTAPKVTLPPMPSFPSIPTIPTTIPSIPFLSPPPSATSP